MGNDKEAPPPTPVVTEEKPLEEKIPGSEQKRGGIWLEVADVRYEGGEDQICSVLLRADREQPKPVWWPVKSDAVRDTPYETYKAILNEIDKKRMVLAKLACCFKRVEDDKVDFWLRCDSFRFQSPEPGSR